MSFVLQPGEFLDPLTGAIWGPSSVPAHPCDDPGCYVRSEYELMRTVSGTCLPHFACRWHVPKFIVGTGQLVTFPGPSGAVVDAADVRWLNGVEAAPAAPADCDECYGTGRYHGIGHVCSKGCKLIP